MRLTSLAVRNLRRFTDERWDLRAPDGSPAAVIGVVGPNESGKSTLLDGILLALFEQADWTKKEIAALSRWGCRERPAVELEFEHGGDTYRLLQDYEARKSELVNLNSGERLTSPRRVRERLGEMLGAPSREFFRATAAVAQGEIAALAAARGLEAALERAALSGGGMTAAELVERIKDELKEMRKGLERPAKNPGLLKRLEDEVDRLKDELAEQGGKIAEARRLEEEIEADETRLAELERELGEKEKRLDRLETAARLSKELASTRRAAREAHENLKRGEALLGEAQGCEKKAAELHAPGRDALVAALEKARRAEAARAVVAGVLAAAAVVLGIAASRWWLLLLVPAAVLAGAWARRLERARRGPSPEQVLAGVGAASPGELRQRIEEGDRLLGEAREKAAELRGLAGAEGEEALKSLREKAARLDSQAGELASRLEREGNVPAPSEEEELDRKRRELEKELLDLGKEVEKSKEELEKLKQRLAGNRGRLEELERDGVDSGGLLDTDEKLAAAEAALEHARAREKMLEAALELAEEARARLGESVRAEVGREAGRLAGELTLSRYNDLELAPEGGGLSVSVHSEEAGERVPSEALSVGAREQLYLACRVALARGLLGEEAPLFLDDPFVNYDDTRREAALALLRWLAGRGQIVVFSAREDIEAFCDCVVRLGGHRAEPGRGAGDGGG